MRLLINVAETTERYNLLLVRAGAGASDCRFDEVKAFLIRFEGSAGLGQCIWLFYCIGSWPGVAFTHPINLSLHG